MQSACPDCKNPTLIFEEVLDPFPEMFDFRVPQRADRLLRGLFDGGGNGVAGTSAFPNGVWERGERDR